MTRMLMVMLLMVAGATTVTAGPARAALESEAEASAALAEAVSALQEAAELRLRDAGEEEIDRLTAEALLKAARAVDRIADARSYVGMLQATTPFLQRELVARLRTGSLGEGLVADAWDELSSAKLQAALRITHRGQDGPDTNCTGDLVGCYLHCSELRTFAARAACGMDCEIDFVSCLLSRLPIIGDVLREQSPDVIVR
jgi:hypothetical protein